MKPAFEPDVDIGFQPATSQGISGRQGPFACALHQLPVRQGHSGKAGLDAPGDHIRISPIRVDRGDAYDAGAHGHDFCRTIRPQGDCLDCHRYSIDSCRLEIPAVWTTSNSASWIRGRGYNTEARFVKITS